MTVPMTQELKVTNAVNELIKTCCQDEFPNTQDCLHIFMFDRCRNMEELQNLLGLYTGIIKLDDDFDEEELKNAILNKGLINFIIKACKNKQSYYIKWFKLNIERFLL